MITKADMREIADIEQFAKVTKTCWIALDRLPPLAMHNYLKIPKGTIVGIVDIIEGDLPDFGDPPSNKVRVYAPNENALYLGYIEITNIKVLKS